VHVAALLNVIELAPACNGANLNNFMVPKMSKPPIQPIRTLADCDLPQLRCTNCGHEYPPSTHVEIYTSANLWIVVHCLKCDRTTPFQLEVTA